MNANTEQAEIRRQRLQEVLKEFLNKHSTPNKRATQKQFLDIFYDPESSEKLVDESFLSQMKTGRSPVPTTFARAIEKKFDKPKFWMDTPDSDISEPSNAYLLNETAKNGVSTHQAGKSVPVLSSHQAVEWKEHMENKTTLFCPTECTDNTFCVAKEDDSMTAPYPSPDNIPRGSIAFIDPGANYASGDAVLAHLPGDDETIIRLFIKDGLQQKLVPLNAVAYSTIDIAHIKADIIGPVIGTFQQRKRKSQ